MNIILAILVLSVIILVHEFGHFIMAKANGVMVLEFCLGFGPKLIHFKKGDTVYSIKLFPFGGACMMLGEDFSDEEADEEKALEDAKKDPASDQKERSITKGYDMTRSFANKSIWARASILAAGPIFNFLLAFILAVFIIGFIGYDPCIADKIYEDSPAAAAGLREGDKIISVNGRGITFSRELTLYTMVYPEKTLEITYEREGQKYTATVTPEYQKSENYMVGISIAQNCAVSSVVKDSPAQKAGLLPNDIIKSIDGQKITVGNQFSEVIRVTQDKEVVLLVERDGKELSLNITPQLTETESYYTGLLSYGERVKASPLSTLGYGVKEVGYWIRTVFDSLSMLVRGKVALDDVSGPVGVVNVIGNVVEQSKPDGAFYILLNLFNMAIMISANLGVMNLLPIPALDGGRLLFLIIEAVRGKPMSKEKEGMVHFVGMVLLMVLMVFILFNDVKNIFW